VLITVTSPTDADLVMSKEVDNPAPTAGQVVVYTLRVSNNGPVQATGVVVGDALPGGVSYVADDGGGAYNAAGGAWTVGVLEVGTSSTLHITVTVDAGMVGETITNTAVISAADQADLVPGNNTASAVIAVWGKVYLPLMMRNY